MVYLAACLWPCIEFINSPTPSTHTHTYTPTPHPRPNVASLLLLLALNTATQRQATKPGVDPRKQKTRQLYECTSRTRLYIKNNPLMAATLSGYRRRGQGQQRQAIDRPEGQRMVVEEATVYVQISKISDSLPPTHIAITFITGNQANCDQPTPCCWQPGQP